MKVWYISPLGTGTGDGMTSANSKRYSLINELAIENNNHLIFKAGTYTDSATIQKWVYIRPEADSDRNIIFNCSTNSSMILTKGCSFQRCPNFDFRVNTNYPAIKFELGQYDDTSLKPSSTSNVLFKGTGSGIAIQYSAINPRAGSKRVTTGKAAGTRSRGVETAPSNVTVTPMKFAVDVTFSTFYDMSIGVDLHAINSNKAYSVEVISNVTGNIFESVATPIKKNPDVYDTLAKVSVMTSFNNFRNYTSTVPVSVDGNQSEDPGFVLAPTDFKLTMTSKCINKYTRSSTTSSFGYWDLGCYGGLEGYDWVENFIDDYEVKLVTSNGFSNYGKLNPDTRDTPGRNYKPVGDVLATGYKATGSFVIGEKNNLDRFTPDFSSVAQFVMRATIDNTNWLNFLESGGTLTPELGFKFVNNLDPKVTTSEMARLGNVPPTALTVTYPTTGASWYGWMPFKVSGNVINNSNKTIDSDGRIYIISDLITEINRAYSLPIINGIYIVYVRIRYDLGSSSGYMNTYCIFKFNNQSPSIAVSEDKTDVNPGEVVKFTVDKASGPTLPFDRILYRKEFYDGSIWESERGDMEVRMQDAPIILPTSFQRENSQCRIWAKARMVNGLWSSVEYSNDIYTKLLDPPTPSVEINSGFDGVGGSGAFVMTDNKDYAAFNYTSDPYTNVQFQLERGSTESGYTIVGSGQFPPTSTYTGLGRELNDDDKHIVWPFSPIQATYLNSGLYRWGIRYINLRNAATQWKYTTFKLGSQTLEWRPDLNVKPRNLVTIPEEYSDRKRVSVNIGEADIYSTTYAAESVLISKEYVFPKEIYKVMLSVSEQTEDFLTGATVGTIDYYLSFNKGKTWSQINPMERTPNQEISDILTINSGLTEEQKRLSGKPVYSYIDMGGNTRTAILKAVLKRTEDPKSTPRIFSYGIKVISRDVLRRQP